MVILKIAKSIVFSILIFSCSIVFAADFRIENVEVHLVDSLEDASNYGRSGFIQTLPADSGTRFLCMSCDLVGSNWEEKEKPHRIDGKKVVLEVAGKPVVAMGTFSMKGRFSTFSPTVYLSRPYSKSKTESSYRVRPIFVVPADFATGTLKLGDSASIEISATDSKPMVAPSEYTDFKVLDTQFVENLETSKYMSSGTKTIKVTPIRGKFLKVKIEIIPKLTNNTRAGSYSLASSDLSLYSNGALIPCVGQKFSSDSKFATSMTTSVNIGNSSTRDFYFVVNEGLESAKLIYVTEEVGEVKVSK